MDLAAFAILLIRPVSGDWRATCNLTLQRLLGQKGDTMPNWKYLLLILLVLLAIAIPLAMRFR